MALSLRCWFNCGMSSLGGWDDKNAATSIVLVAELLVVVVLLLVVVCGTLGLTSKYVGHKWQKFDR